MEATKQFEPPSDIQEIIKTLPKQNCCWLKGMGTMYKYQDFWIFKKALEGAILAQRNLKAHPSNVFLCSYPKSGTTWLKSLVFAIITREKFDSSNSPLLTNGPHNCILFLEVYTKQILENHSPYMATHLPYGSLPESILASNCKLVYIYRNIKDVINSSYHFSREISKLAMEDVAFEEAFDEFCKGISLYGPYWDHILGYWKASLERPEMILFLKYEDLKKDPISNVKRLAEFIGRSFTTEEEKAGVIESIVKLCSFENLRNLEVNKNGVSTGFLGIENRLYFRKAKDGDWENYFTDEMIEKIDKLIDEKLSGTGLVLK